MNYIVYKDKEILRTGSCPASMMNAQAGPGEYVKEGKLRNGTDDRTQKMQGDQVVDKTPSEIEADNPSIVPIPEEDRPTVISKKDWQALQNTVVDLQSQITERKGNSV